MSARSGVILNSECVKVFSTVKSGKKKCCIFKISDDEKHIVFEEDTDLSYNRKPQPATFEKFLKFFPDNKCRYGIYNAWMGCKQGQEDTINIREKLVFVTWSPDVAKTRDKMLCSSSKDTLKKICIGIALELQCNDASEASAQSWIDQLSDMPTIKIAGDIISFEGRNKEDWD